MITRKADDPAKRAVEFVNMVDQFPCEITFQINDATYSGKSVISMMVGDFDNQKELEFVCSGAREEEAMERICDWFDPEHKTVG